MRIRQSRWVPTAAVGVSTKEKRQNTDDESIIGSIPPRVWFVLCFVCEERERETSARAVQCKPVLCWSFRLAENVKNKQRGVTASDTRQQKDKTKRSRFPHPFGKEEARKKQERTTVSVIVSPFAEFRSRQPFGGVCRPSGVALSRTRTTKSRSRLWQCDTAERNILHHVGPFLH